MSIGNRTRATIGYVAVLCSAVAASAQTFTGAVVGRVVDSQQSAVAGASITLHSSERDFERHTFANIQGEYAFELLPPGRFSVRAESSGFAPTAAIVEVVVATPVRANLVLRVQPLKEEVKVLGESGVSVQTENASQGRVVSPREMTELPSLGRRPYDFIALMPGATFSNDGAGVGFAVNGGRTQSANYLLDGAENNETMAPAPAQDVPLDSIQEFNVQTNHYSAEYGRNSGFTANIVTKSGTNTFHGSLYDYFRNSALAANTFDANAHGLSRPVFNRNQFGGTLGGPIRQGKLFYFAALETILVRSNGWNYCYVPTPQLLEISSPGTQAIFERFPLPRNLSSTDVHQEKLCPFGATCNAQTGVGYVTIPAFAFTTRLGPQDFGGGPPQNTILATGRLDWMLGPNTQAFLRYAVEQKDEFAVVNQPYSSKLDQSMYGDNQNVTLNVIHTWLPTLATESRIAYARVTGDPDRIAGNAYSVPSPPLPFFYILDETGVSLPGGSPSTFGPLNSYQFFQTMTYSRARHTLRFGGQYVYMRQNITFGYAGEIADAQFPNTQAFVNGSLSLYSIALDPKGHSPGEFVAPPFGPPSFTRHYRYNEPALFIADTWKLTARLALTPGLRWEYFGVFHSPGSEHSLDSNFYPGPGSNFLNQISNGKMLRTIDAPGELQGRFYLPDYKNFAPRLGIAYDLFGDGKTVLRAGAGIFYDRRVGWELFRAYQNLPGYSFTRLTNIPVTPGLVQNQYAALPDSPIQLTQSLTNDPDIHTRSSFTGSWNATIEKEIAGTYVAGISYLGSSGSRLYSINNVNRVGSGGLLYPSCITARIAADGATPLGPDYSNCPRLNSYLSNVAIRSNGGHSSYQALQLRVDSRRVQRIGLEFGGNYTWSHSIDNRSASGLTNSVAETGQGYLDAFRPSLDRGSSDFDVRHRVAAHIIWELPLGNHSSSWAAHYLARGWEVSGILSYQTGQPFTIADSGTPDARGERTRPRLTGQLPLQGALIADAVSPNTYLYLPLNRVYDPISGKCIANTAPFGCEISVNGPFEGTVPRNTFCQPGLFYQDTALLKNFPLPWRETQVQFRAEFYNVFNHPNLYVNGGTTDISTNSFTDSAGAFVPGVTASFSGNREIVLALRVLF
jgi:Carboxypeptidase regulatory-like domain/TonB-dependent Receptor Plug Domain